jgi:hypothetical protein
MFWPICVMPVASAMVLKNKVKSAWSAIAVHRFVGGLDSRIRLEHEEVDLPDRAPV